MHTGQHRVIISLKGFNQLQLSAQLWTDTAKLKLKNQTQTQYPNSITNNKYLDGPPLVDCCRPSVGIYIGPLLGAQIGMRSLQWLANGWPNNVIVKLTVVPLQGLVR